MYIFVTDFLLNCFVSGFAVYGFSDLVSIKYYFDQCMTELVELLYV